MAPHSDCNVFKRVWPANGVCRRVHTSRVVPPFRQTASPNDFGHKQVVRSVYFICVDSCNARKLSRGPSPNPKAASGRKNAGGRGRGLIANPFWAEHEHDSMGVGEPHFAEPHPVIDGSPSSSVLHGKAVCAVLRVVEIF